MEDPESQRLIPVRSAKSTVKRAAGILLAVAFLTFGIAYWVNPLAIVFWPLVMITAIAVVFATPLLKSGPPVLTIDEAEVYDARIMKRPVPWSKISRVTEISIRNPVTGSVIDKAFILEIANSEGYIKFPLTSLFTIFTSLFNWQIFMLCISNGAIPIVAIGLDYSTEGLRDTFDQARTIGLLRS